jgi:hypothetical protein
VQVRAVLFQHLSQIAVDDCHAVFKESRVLRVRATSR